MDRDIFLATCHFGNTRATLYATPCGKVYCNTAIYMDKRAYPYDYQEPINDLSGVQTRIPRSLMAEAAERSAKPMEASEKFEKFLQICWKRAQRNLPYLSK